MTVRIQVGHVLDEIAKLSDESVHMVWTSPPYWGLRAYSTEPQVWGGEKNCAHVWGEERQRKTGRNDTDRETPGGRGGSFRGGPNVAGSGAFCDDCNAWRGEHGQEPTLDLWLQHEVEIFREVRRVLRKDGTLWLNVGDAYACQPNGRSAQATKKEGDDDRTFRDKPFSTAGRAGRSQNRGNTASDLATRAHPTRTGLAAKQRLMLPARLALALQNEGWWLRDEIVLHKLNPMPSSVADRTTPAHEMLYLFAKRPRYYYDSIAIREPAALSSRQALAKRKPSGWDKRSVWSCAIEPYREAHFATAPTAWVIPCILAGTSARGVCPDCGAPWGRVQAVGYQSEDRPQMKRAVELFAEHNLTKAHLSAMRAVGITDAGKAQHTQSGYGKNDPEMQRLAKEAKVVLKGYYREFLISRPTTAGWRPICRCYDARYYTEFPRTRNARKRSQQDATGTWRLRVIQRPGKPEWRTIRATVLDPFGGSGTVGLVADNLGRDAIMIELNPNYAALARNRLRQGLARLQSDIAEQEPDDTPLFTITELRRPAMAP